MFPIEYKEFFFPRKDSEWLAEIIGKEKIQYR